MGPAHGPLPVHVLGYPWESLVCCLCQCLGYIWVAFISHLMGRPLLLGFQGPKYSNLALGFQGHKSLKSGNKKYIQPVEPSKQYFQHVLQSTHSIHQLANLHNRHNALAISHNRLCLQITPQDTWCYPVKMVYLSRTTAQQDQWLGDNTSPGW